MTVQTETHRFEAEVQQVLGLVIHSLYKHREIFLRELISNASDALDKLRFESLTHPELLEDGGSLGIALEIDRDARELRIADNGIGMTREELVENLGTIASSGTRRFLDELKKAGSSERPELIGQFGVGFYSSFMVADSVTVETRRAGQEAGWRWRSAGTGEYELEPAEGLARGTLITLHLRAAGGEDDDDGEQGADEFLEPHRVREIVSTYSDFVEYPIQMEIETQEVERDDEGKPIEGAEPQTVSKTETLNSMKPLWARPKDKIEEEELNEFYRHLSHDWHEPLDAIHFKAEGKLEYTALLFLPKERSFDLFDPKAVGSRVSLYARRVLIMRDCEDLLPPWLRFVRGVVECDDVSLNVSRESLQDDPKVRQIKKRLVKKVLDTLGDLLEKDREKYEVFWRSFGLVLKEGIYYGEDEDQRISKVCLFESSVGDGLTTLAEYVRRMEKGQEAIYTLHAPDRRTAEASPHLEALRAKGFEVLFLLDGVDEWMLQRLTEYDGKPIRSLEHGDVDLETKEEKTQREKKQEENEGLLKALADALDEEVSEVRFSARLKDSPAVLVASKGAFTPQMERMLRHSGQDVPKQKRILELNPDHALVGALKKLYDVDSSSERVGEYGELLFGQARIAEGETPPDPARFTKLLTNLMVQAATS